MKKVLVLLGMVALLGCSGNLERGLVKGMAALDRAYIPVLFYTSAESEQDPSTAMKRLQDEWNYFRTRFYYYDRQDTAWQASLNQVGALIAEAGNIVTRGGDKSLAHASLEEVQRVLGALRDRQGIDYYLDGLMVFHYPMEEFVSLAAARTPMTLTRNDIRTLGRMLPSLRSTWDSLATVSLDTALFGFDEKRASLVTEQVMLETISLDALQQALNSGSRNAIITAAAEIKPEFVKLYQLFGDFTLRE
ncbi:MAG: hypothetical protein KAU50_11165 [Candidatus Marinimicrobia bacterium]|nr:hypothetical protein [Candidatus Neomarinimicrobiota bacterium]